MLEAAASELPLLLVRNLLDDIKMSSIREREHKENKMALKKIREFYKSYQKDNSTNDIKDFIEYMVDTRYDNQNDGKYWTISMGYKPEDNIRNEVKDFVALRTKAQSEVKKGRRIDQGYRPAAFAR